MAQGCPELASRLSNLSNSLFRKFGYFGNPDDLDRAILTCRKAISLVPEDDPTRPIYLFTLPKFLLTRFDKFGDLEGAVSTSEEALRLAPGGHPERANCLACLSNSLRYKFMLTHNPDDLELAITNYDEAVRLTPEDHSMLPTYLANLAVALQTRFTLSGELSDLDGSQLAYEKAILLTPARHSNRTLLLSKLCICLGFRFDLHRNANDLERAITTCDTAALLTPEGHPDQSRYFGNLGRLYHTRFQHRADLFPSASVSLNIVDRIPASFPSHSSSLEDVTLMQCAVAGECGENDDLDRALSYLRRSMLCTSARPGMRFRNAHCLARIALDNDQLECALEGFSTAIDMLPLIAWRGTNELTQLEQLRSHAQGFACDAASCAILLGKPERAVELLVQGRSIFWFQASELRSDLSDLQASEPDLAAKLDSVRRALDIGSREDSFIDTANQESAELVTQRYHRLAQEFEQLLKEIRQIDRFKTFLLPAAFGQLRHAAAGGPVVVLNASTLRCDALLVTCKKPVKVTPLETTSRQELQGLAQSLREVIQRFESRQIAGEELDDRLLIVLHRLWTSVVEPVLTHIPQPGKATLNCLWWCPTGPFTSLPIHAAGIYPPDGGHSNLADILTSSYASTLGSLLHAQPSPAKPQPDFRVLGTALLMPPQRHPGMARLDYAADEIKIMKDLSSLIPFELELLNGKKSKVESVMAALRRCPWAHFSCHGVQESDKPLESFLCLYDANLTVSKIASVQLPHAEFAFLSACHTAVGSVAFEDEAFHVAAGLQFAGFRSVVGTLWFVSDKHAPQVTARVYEHLFASDVACPDRPDPTKAAFALGKAMRFFRDENIPLHIWVPFIHLGV
jgi:CHAT domain-containing protein